MENKPTYLTLLPYWITGDSYQTLKGYDVNSRKKINQLGWFVLIPTLLWFITGYLIQVELLGGSVVVGLITAAICAFFIFILERSIVMARRSHWTLILIRTALGLVVAGLGSFVMDLVIFKSDIDHYARRKYEAIYEARRDSIAKLELSFTDTLNKEMTGKGGSHQRGIGVISQELKKQVLDLKSKAASLDSVHTAEQAASFNSKDIYHNKLTEKLGLNTIAHRSVLLHELIDKDPFTKVIWLSLLVLGLLFEIMPVVSKQATGKSTYEQDLEAYEIIRTNQRRITLQDAEYYANLDHQQRLLQDTIKRNIYFPFK